MGVDVAMKINTADPFFLNMLATFIYIPICFMYTWVMLLFDTGTITKEMRSVPKYKFAIIGMLDCFSGGGGDNKDGSLCLSPCT